MLEHLLKIALEHAPELIVTLFVAILSPFLVKWVAARASLADLDLIIRGADIVVPVIDQVARKTPGKNDDKAVRALEMMVSGLKVARTAKGKERAKLALAARHELDVQARR